MLNNIIQILPVKELKSLRIIIICRNNNDVHILLWLATRDSSRINIKTTRNHAIISNGFTQFIHAYGTIEGK